MTGVAKTARYRARQFFSALKPTVSVEGMALVKSVLGNNSSALTLFLQMGAADQQHAIAVLQTLRNRGEDYPALQQAALLHDVGKAMGQPLLHRVAIVLLQAFWPAALRKLAAAPLSCPAWRRPFVVHAQHPQIGATWAGEAGCDPMVVSLIERHQKKPALHPAGSLERLHKRLYEADGKR